MSGISWGDAPEWGALTVAAIGGWVALAQLRQQQKVITKELTRGAALEEARLRQQAESVDVAWSSENAQETFVEVVNKSRRPIRGLECRIVSDADGKLIARPAKAGEMKAKRFFVSSDWVLPRDGVSPGQWCNVLRAGGHAGFRITEPAGPGQRALVQFVDDAGLHWQLDNELHLERLTTEL
jgi:hypothetical protein